LQTLITNNLDQESVPISSTLENIPEYSGSAYITIDNNVPSFDESDMIRTSFEKYSNLDTLGRCGIAFANIGQDLMPIEKRGNISQVKPSGWHSIQYDNVDGKSLYNRCHLIGYQLTAENANQQNLITGTRYLNVEGMLPFENMVTDYIIETNNHVLYRVTPLFKGTNLVADGVLMEGYSVEDDGEGICFKVYVYNVQPGITIDYATGESRRIEDTAVVKTDSYNEGVEIRANTNSMIYHCPGQSAYEDMANSKYLVIFHSEKEAQEEGYRKAKR
jgi:DNA-entry nuclease